MTIQLELRQDLELIDAQMDENGASGRVLYDRSRHCFFRLGWQEVEILRELSTSSKEEKNIDEMAARLTNELHVPVEPSTITDFIEFLSTNALVECRSEEQRDYLLKRQSVNKVSPVKKILNSYLFIRIPLVHPNRVLDKLLPYVSWLFHRYTLWVLVLLSVMGVYLMTRQWEQFTSSLSGLLTPVGLSCFFIALAFVKILHELGHALAAKQFGCSVPTLGLAFMVFWPVLYTDTTDAWRLKSRRERLWIGAAGIIMELAIAACCLLAWNILPEGLLKNICFLLATTTWLMTLAVNLNPLMRFDGYFLLSDWIGVENLQERAFSLGRWRLRTWLFGLKEAAPEKPRATLILFAYCAWLYRLVLFVGIGWIIYELFFKLLGVLLVVFYVVNALLRPVSKEILYYMSQTKNMQLFPNVALTITLFILLCIWFFFPYSSTITIPGYLNASGTTKLYAPVDGQLITLPKNDQMHKKGGLLFSFDTPDVDQEIKLIELEIEALQWQLEHHSLSEGRLQPFRRIQSELGVVMNKLAALRAVQSNNQVLAPIEGSIKDLSPKLVPGDWVAKGTGLGTIIKPERGQVVAYISERDLNLIKLGSRAIFYADGGMQKNQNIQLTEIEPIAIDVLEEPYNASIYGGELKVKQSHDGKRIEPVEATYGLKFSMIESAPQRVLSGKIVLDAEPKSVFSEVKNRLLGIWRREAGF